MTRSIGVERHRDEGAPEHPRVDPLLVDRVRTRLAAAGGLPTPAAVAAAVRAETGGVTTDLDVLAALRVLRH